VLQANPRTQESMQPEGEHERRIIIIIINIINIACYHYYLLLRSTIHIFNMEDNTWLYYRSNLFITHETSPAYGA